MSGRFARSWSLVKASGSVLKEDKELLVFPLISTFAMLLVVAAFIVPMFSTGMIHTLAQHGDWTMATYAWAFLYYAPAATLRARSTATAMTAAFRAR